jgi:hypothetical protein
MILDDERWDAFWTWVRTRLCPRWPQAPGAVDQALVAELGREVDGLGRFDFEVGPMGDDRFLAVSPRGDAERHAQTKAIVARAPVVDGWVFLSAKPEKDWDLSRFQIVREGALCSMDLSGWEFVTLRFSDGVCDVYLRPSAGTGLARDELLSIAATVVDGAIGEARRIEGVAWIDVKDEWDDRQRPAARPLTVEGLRRALRGPSQR